MKVNSLEFDVKYALITSPHAQLQWHRIRDELYPKYENEYEKGSFTTVLHRKLRKMLMSGDIEKKGVGHQEVFYFIPKKNLKKIREELDRELAHRRFDEVWNAFSPEQRKRELKTLYGQRAQAFMITNNIIMEIAESIKEMSTCYISSLQNPTEEGEAKYSPQEREQLLKELQNGVVELEKMEKRSVNHQKVISDSVFQERLNLTKEFIEKVVEPKYSGNWEKAFFDLMRKALAEQKTEGK
jgi:hypothetical protein